MVATRKREGSDARGGKKGASAAMNKGAKAKAAVKAPAGKATGKASGKAAGKAAGKATGKASNKASGKAGGKASGKEPVAASKHSTPKAAAKENGEKAKTKAEDRRVDTPTSNDGKDASKAEPRRSGRNHESSLPLEERKKMEEVRVKETAKKHQMRAQPTRGEQVKQGSQRKKGDRGNGNSSKPGEEELYAVEPYEPEVYEPVLLDEHEKDEVLRKAEEALARQAAAAKGLWSLGLRSVPVSFGEPRPAPLLQLSRDDELRPAFRVASEDTAGEDFAKYFAHPYQSSKGGGKGGGDEDGNEDGNEDGVDGEGGATGAGAASASARTGTAEAGIKSPSLVHGDRPTPRKDGQGDDDQGDQQPAGKRAKYDVEASGRRSTRVSGKQVKYAESDSSFDSSDYGTSSDDSLDSGMFGGGVGEVGSTWEDIFPDDADMDETCYRKVEQVAPFKSVGVTRYLGRVGGTTATAATLRAVGTAGTVGTVPPCAVAPMNRIRYRRNAQHVTASGSAQSLGGLGGDGDEDVTGPAKRTGNGQVRGLGKTFNHSDLSPDHPGYHTKLVKEINRGDGSALEHLGMALRQVVKTTPRTGSLPLVEVESMYSPWALEVKDTYTWYSGFDVVHGMSYVHPLVMRTFMPVHPVYYGDSPRVKWLGPLSKLPRIDPSKNYLQAALQYIRLTAVQAGNLPAPLIEAQKLVARQFNQYEIMLDRIVELRKEEFGSAMMHKNVRLKRMVGGQNLLLSPLMFSPRHLLVGQDPETFCARERQTAPRKNPVSVESSLAELAQLSAPPRTVPLPRSPIASPGGIPPGNPDIFWPSVTMYDRGLLPPLLFQGKRPLKLTDLPPPFPTAKAMPPPYARKIVYKVDVPGVTGPSLSGTAGGGDNADDTPKVPVLHPKTGRPLTDKEIEDKERKRERENRAHERKERMRAEMGEDAWKAEMRRREEHRAKKKIKYQTTKKCKDALEWCQEAARFPTSQTFTQHTVIDRLKRATQVTREMHLKKQQNLHTRPVVHYLNSKNSGIYVRLRTAEDEAEMIRMHAERERIAREEKEKKAQEELNKPSKPEQGKDKKREGKVSGSADDKKSAKSTKSVRSGKPEVRGTDEADDSDSSGSSSDSLSSEDDE